MDTKTLTELAYYRIRDAVALFCTSEEGSSYLRSQEPLTKSEEFEKRKSYSKEWVTLLHAVRTNPLAGWQPIESIVQFAKADGAALTLSQLYALYQFCTSAQQLTHTITQSAQSLPIENLAKLTETLPASELAQALHVVSAVVDANGELRDIPVLREIRASIARIQADIAHALRAYTSDVTLNSVLASHVPAYRADRQVLAVKAAQRTRIHGIVHEVSQSGQTVFIEPAEVVRKNNELVQEEFRLQAEIRKICAEATAKLQPLTEALSATRKTMLLLDITLAAARWGIQNKCTYALPCYGGEPPLLQQARHPLLGVNAVPITIPFLPHKRVLVITGPNTGGKTVALKTFALLAMLNQAGFPVPAAEGTRIPVFTSVFADIGDEQSIDQSLSTFSAHMKNIALALMQTVTALCCSTSLEAALTRKKAAPSQ